MGVVSSSGTSATPRVKCVRPSSWSLAVGGSACAGRAVETIAPGLPADAPPAGDAKALLGSIADNLLALSPEGATSLGIDTGARAAMRGQLGDRSAAGQKAVADMLKADIARVRAFDKAGLDHATRTSLAVVESAYGVALDGFAQPYGDVAVGGWRWGFWGPGIAATVAAVAAYYAMADRPRSLGLPTVADWRNDHYAPPAGNVPERGVFATQLSILAIPAVWILALASAANYVTRYAINSWGILYLQEARGYSLAEAGAIYLEDSGVDLLGLRWYGSPWQPRFFDWAFNADRGAPLRQIWAQIPSGTDVLLTHGPPHGILDTTVRGQSVGCEELTLAIQRVRPKLHVFGHIHECYGQLVRDGTHYVNASSCNLQYLPIHPPIVVDL